MTRAITDPEKAKYRSDNQSAHRYLAFPTPLTVYTARLDALPTSNDEVEQITYVSGSGTLAHVLTDMTLLIGSTAGAADLGVARIRKAPTSTIFYLNEMSEVAWTASAYLTVLDDVGLWPRHIIAHGSVVLMDVDITYSDQHANFDPVPVFGPDLALRLINGSVTHQRDASDSWVIGSTITTYAWSAPGASATSGLSTATPTITYNTTGWFRESLTLTAANGKSFTGHRYVYVWDDAHLPTVEFKLNSATVTQQAGGPAFQAVLWDASIIASIHKLQPVILFARDWYGGVEGSIGPVPGAEPIAAIGWITQETVNWQPEELPSEVTIDVQGPQWWLNKITAFPAGVRDKSSASTKWIKIQNLTPRKGYFHFLHWRTTATARIDVYPCACDTPMGEFSAPTQSVWTQLNDALDKSIFAKPYCNRYGQLFAEVNPNLVPVADRSAFPEVMTITKADWRGPIAFTHREAPEVGYVDFSGVSWDNASQKATPLFVIAPGHVPKSKGSADPRTRYLLVNQAQANALGGLYLGWKNNPVPQISIPLAANDRLVGIAPRQYVVLSIGATDMPAALGLSSSLRIVPTGIRYAYDENAQTYFTTIDGEAETFPDLSITGDTPPTPPTPPANPPPPQPYPIPPVPGLTADASEVWFATAGATPKIIWSSDFFTATKAGGQPTWNVVAGLPSGFTAFIAFAPIMDGSMIYITAIVSGKRGLWMCSNPKAGSPGWTKVLQENDIAPNGDNIATTYGPDFGALVRHNASVTTAVTTNGNHNYVVEVTGGVITWYNLFGFGGVYSSRDGQVGYRAYLNDYSTTLRSLPGSTSIGSYDSFGGHTPSVWQNLVGGHVYGIRYTASLTGNYYLRDISAGADQISTLGSAPARSWGEFAYHCYPRGAHKGPEIDYVDGLGQLWTAPDGATFANVFTWQMGVVEQAKLLGGGPLVWMVAGTTNSNEIIRVSFNKGVTWLTVTGNYWTGIQMDGLGFFLVDMYLVFR